MQGGLNCDFENGLCSWKNAGESDWVISAGFDGDPPDTGPNVDHTFNSSVGHFLQADSTNQSSGTTPYVLKSAVTQSVTSFCFSFFYYMHGAELGDLFLSVSVYEVYKHSEDIF